MVQLPAGASVPRTGRVVGQVEELLKGMPQVQDVISIVGFSFLENFAASNTAFIIARLKPFEERTAAADSAQAVIARVFGEGQQIRAATVQPFNLPPIIGLSSTGGFEYMMESLRGADPVALGSAMRGMVSAANADPRLSRVFSTYTAGNPSLFLEIDRVKARALGVSMGDVFTTLQATLGGFFVNQFNLYGRVWQVNIQGEAADRRDPSALWKIQFRNSNGAMVPLRSIATLRTVTGPAVVTRYNNYRAVPINGSPAPGVSSGQAQAAMADVSARTLPTGYAFEWTGTRSEERSVGKECRSR